MESKAAQQYFSRVRRRLACPAASRDQLLGRGRKLVAQFEQENPDAKYVDFVAAFGPPGDFAGEMLSCVDSGAVEATQRRCRRVKQIILIGLALVLCIGGGFGWFQWSKYGKYQELFDDMKDADFVIVQHGPYEITDEEVNATRQEAGIPLPKNGG